MIQLVPLPPAVWTRLPGRGAVVVGFQLLKLPLPWLPLSLEPYETMSSGLSLLPAAAVYVCMVRLGAFRASWIAWAVLGAVLLSVLVGALQITGGDESPWRFYKITNRGVMVGFFSNANHFATLLVSAIPFVAAMYIRAVERGRSVQKSSALSLVLAGAMAVIVVGVALSGSLAAVGLTVPVLAASGLLILRQRRPLSMWWAALIAVLLVGGTAAVFTEPFQNNLTSSRAVKQEDSRRNSFAKTTPLVRRFFPTGSGLGTFQKLYREHEDPNTVSRFYMNHVHGDYIEIALETGLVGFVVLLLFFGWWARQAWLAWAADAQDHFARAGSIASAAMLAHSLVDYPLRTAAISALLACCCGLMAGAKSYAPRRRGEAKSTPRHLSAD